MKTPTTDVITTTISQALGYPTATPLRRLKGKLALVWDKTGGQGKKGPWTKQSGLIEDNGSKMVFTVWNFKGDLMESKGKEVVFFNSNESRKSALVLEDDYKDPTKRSLKVDGKQCSVFVDGISDGVPEDDIPMDFDSSGAPVSSEPKSPPQANVAPKRVLAEEGTSEAYRSAMQFSNLMVVMLSSAKHSIEESGMEFESLENKNDAILRVAITFFIQGKDKAPGMPNNRPIYLKSKKDGRKDGISDAIESTGDKDLF